MTVSPSNVFGSSGGCPGCVSDASAGPVAAHDGRARGRHRAMVRVDLLAPLVPLGLHLGLRGRQLGVRVPFELEDFFDRLDVGVLVLDLGLQELGFVGAGLVLGLEQRLEGRAASRRSSLMLVMEKLSTEPCSRGSSSTADMRAVVALSAGLGRAEELRQELLLRRPRAGGGGHDNRRGRRSDATLVLVLTIAGPPGTSAGTCSIRRLSAEPPRDFLSLLDQRHRHDLVVAVEVHQSHALRGAAHRADLVGRASAGSCPAR